MLMPYARFRSAERWNRIVVSDRCRRAPVVDVVAFGVAVVGAHHQDVERLLGAHDLLLVRPVGASCSLDVDDVEVPVEVAVEPDDTEPGGEAPGRATSRAAPCRPCASSSPCPCAWACQAAGLGARVGLGHAGLSGLGEEVGGSGGQHEPTRKQYQVSRDLPDPQMFGPPRVGAGGLPITAISP